MFRKQPFLFAAAPVLAVAVLFSGCSPQPSHPNQIDAFDGATYDSLTLAHGALIYLRASISSSYPKYVPLFNETAAAYATAVDAYAVFRTEPSSQAAVAADVASLTTSIVALENTVAADMHVSQKTERDIRQKAQHIRAAASSNLSLSDILSELEIAAAVAETIPAAAPYATLAAVIIAATQRALAARTAASGQPIDLATLTPIAPIP
ncbi:MAG TPA: hypothetical protein VF283_13790 [Bryobacteraceae bacterium]